jgi:hypothetical protein
MSWALWVSARYVLRLSAPLQVVPLTGGVGWNGCGPWVREHDPARAIAAPYFLFSALAGQVFGTVKDVAERSSPR